MNDRVPRSPASDHLYNLAGGIGLLFVCMAGADNVLTWLPTNFGNREWEFGTVSASFNGLLSITFGFALIQLWMSRLSESWPLRVLGGVEMLVALAIIGAALLYARNVSVALSAASASGVGTGLTKAVIKTSVQSVAYPVAYLLLARASFKWAKDIANVARTGPKTTKGPGIVART